MSIKAKKVLTGKFFLSVLEIFQYTVNYSKILWPSGLINKT